MGLAPEYFTTMFNKPEGLHMAMKVIQSLALETRTTLPTLEAAQHLNRAPQTLRVWACKENGPLRPIRVHGRLAWKTAEIRALLGVAA